MLLPKDRNNLIFAGILVLFFLSLTVFAYGLGPVRRSVESKTFRVMPRDGFREITSRLHEEGFIRSRLAFELLAFLRGAAEDLKPGVYELSPNLGSLAILDHLVKGDKRVVDVVIPEGASVYDIDRILSEKAVISKGELLVFAKDKKLEGRLFPDTYKFFLSSGVEDVAAKFLDNFKSKAEPLLAKDPKNFETNLILASLLESEVPDYEDQRLVAGLLKKRLAVGMPLQVDSTICYIKEILGERAKNSQNCYPLTPLDFAVDSPYNTYRYKGLPPGPIANPGVSALRSALDPKNSDFWFYLSDPKTKKTIFSKTFEEHKLKRTAYLGK
mgnify:CR=1 FL=1